MLPYGCRATLVKELYPEDYFHNNMGEGIFSTGNVTLTKIAGDCTACVIAMSGISLTNITKEFKKIQTLMSAAGRINGFFSKLCTSKPMLVEWLTALKKFNILGLNVQKSNRDPHMDWWQISGILKCPNPYTNTYSVLEHPTEAFKNHNHFDVTKYNETATLYKRLKLKETNYAKV
jgi:hypothetical protein